MAREKAQAKDARLRPFRYVVLALFLAAITVFSALIINSVVRSVIQMSPGRRADAQTTLSVRECVVLAEGLWTDLEEHRRDFTAHSPVRKADEDWTRFRVTWMDRLRENESQCAVHARSRETLRNVYDRLDALMDLYTTHAVQYAGEIGGSVDRFHAAIDEARKDPAIGRF